VSSRPSQADLEGLLDLLSEAGIEYIVVGGAAAVLHGAPITTQDVDIVHRPDPGNVDRLLDLLAKIDARVRDPAGRVLRPSREDLLGEGQLNLTTTSGPLDVLCRLHDGRDYAELAPSTVIMSDGTWHLRVLDLPTLIQIKSTTGRARDRLVVPILLALQREREREKGNGG